MDVLDDYIKNVIAKGDDGSQILAARTAPSLKNEIGVGSIRVLKDGMNGLAVLDVPKGYSVVVHSAGADPSESPTEYVHSLFYNLDSQALPTSIPVALGNVVDSNSGDLGLIETIGKELLFQSKQFDVAIMNGENAVLGDRVTAPYNLSGTMISLIESSKLPTEKGYTGEGGVNFAYFDPKGKPVSINCDGTGTKTELYERAQTFELAVQDFAAMNLDDAIKFGARAQVLSGVVEYNKSNMYLDSIHVQMQVLANNLDILGILQSEYLPGRMQSFTRLDPAFNISGAVVSTIDEERLANPLAPSSGDYLLAIKSKHPNPRSNGISARRRLMIELGKSWVKEHSANYWHETPQGKRMLEFLATPSTVFYGVFSDLVDKGLATSGYHMSGGAFNGKLARPLAKHGLYANIDNHLHPMSAIEQEFFDLSGSSYEKGYANWPMGNEGFITTKDIDAAQAVLQQHGLESKFATTLVPATQEHSGVRIVSPKNEEILFNGRD